MSTLKNPKEIQKVFEDELSCCMEDIFPALVLGECNCKIESWSILKNRVKIDYTWIPTQVTSSFEFNLDNFTKSSESTGEIIDRVIRLIKFAVIHGKLLK